MMPNRRSSILKPPKPREPLQDLDLLSGKDDDEQTTTTLTMDLAKKRKVSFSSIAVKEFNFNAESALVFHTPAYEAPLAHSMTSDSNVSISFNDISQVTDGPLVTSSLFNFNDASLVNTIHCEKIDEDGDSSMELTACKPAESMELTSSLNYVSCASEYTDDIAPASGTVNIAEKYEGRESTCKLDFIEFTRSVLGEENAEGDLHDKGNISRVKNRVSNGNLTFLFSQGFDSQGSDMQITKAVNSQGSDVQLTHSQESEFNSHGSSMQLTQIAKTSCKEFPENGNETQVLSRGSDMCLMRSALNSSQGSNTLFTKENISQTGNKSGPGMCFTNAALNASSQGSDMQFTRENVSSQNSNKSYSQDAKLDACEDYSGEDEKSRGSSDMHMTNAGILSRSGGDEGGTQGSQSMLMTEIVSQGREGKSFGDVSNGCLVEEEDTIESPGVSDTSVSIDVNVAIVRKKHGNDTAAETGRDFRRKSVVPNIHFNIVESGMTEEAGIGRRLSVMRDRSGHFRLFDNEARKSKAADSPADSARMDKYRKLSSGGAEGRRFSPDENSPAVVRFKARRTSLTYQTEEIICGETTVGEESMNFTNAGEDEEGGSGEIGETDVKEMKEVRQEAEEIKERIRVVKERKQAEEDMNKEREEAVRKAREMKELEKMKEAEVVQDSAVVDRNVKEVEEVSMEIEETEEESMEESEQYLQKDKKSDVGITSDMMMKKKSNVVDSFEVGEKVSKAFEETDEPALALKFVHLASEKRIDAEIPSDTEYGSKSMELELQSLQEVSMGENEGGMDVENGEAKKRVNALKNRAVEGEKAEQFENLCQDEIVPEILEGRVQHEKRKLEGGDMEEFEQSKKANSGNGVDRMKKVADPMRKISDIEEEMVDPKSKMIDRLKADLCTKVPDPEREMADLKKKMIDPQRVMIDQLDEMSDPDIKVQDPEREMTDPKEEMIDAKRVTINLVNKMADSKSNCFNSETKMIDSYSEASNAISGAFLKGKKHEYPEREVEARTEACDRFPGHLKYVVQQVLVENEYDQLREDVECELRREWRQNSNVPWKIRILNNKTWTFDFLQRRLRLRIEFKRETGGVYTDKIDDIEFLIFAEREEFLIVCDYVRDYYTRDTLRKLCEGVLEIPVLLKVMDKRLKFAEEMLADLTKCGRRYNTQFLEGKIGVFSVISAKQNNLIGEIRIDFGKWEANVAEVKQGGPLKNSLVRDMFFNLERTPNIMSIYVEKLKKILDS